jgi:TetR/AcrR family transcriptional repressor of nem operon
MTEPTPRGRGRPREFSPDEAVAAATEEFWARGYDAVSVGDIERCTGVVRTGLYNVFGNKRGLFDAALDHYLASLFADIDARLLGGDDGLADIHGFLDRLADSDANRAWGCLMLNTMVEFGDTDEAISERGHRYLDQLSTGYRSALERARARGEIGPDAPLSPLSDQLLLATLGLNLSARVRAGDAHRARLFDAAHALLDRLR